MRTSALAATTAVVAAILIAHPGLSAQTAQLASGQVSGAELQSWVDADGLAVAGYDLKRNCHFMAKNKQADRHLTVFCSDQSGPWTVKGEGKVVGNSWCVKFRYPDQTADEHCEEFFRLGENRYEIRLNGSAVDRVYRLVP